MVSFIGGLLLLFLLLNAIKAFGRVSPAMVARWARRGGVFVAAASLVYLLFGGQVRLIRLLALGLFSALNPRRFDPLGGDFVSAGKSRSRLVRTAWIEMALDIDDGSMRGDVRAGPFAGRELSALSLDESLRLLSLARRQDPDGARLLETYFDRRFAAWREADQSEREAGPDGGGGRRSSGAMTRDEAYEILGLPKGAGAEEIVRAHRSLMKKLHPDHGGSTALAARVNQAKDVLLERHG